MNQELRLFITHTYENKPNLANGKTHFPAQINNMILYDIKWLTDTWWPYHRNDIETMTLSQRERNALHFIKPVKAIRIMFMKTIS